MFEYYISSMKQIQSILSSLLNGNNDCVDLIMGKTKMIEQNEALFYHVKNGIQGGILHSYTMYALNSNGEIHYDLKGNLPKPDHYINKVTIYDRINSIPWDKEIFNGFFDTVVLNKIENVWNHYSNDQLKKDIRFCTKVLVGCLGLQGFVIVREISGPRMYFREATIKEKTRAINEIFRKYGIIYLDLIRIEYEMNDILHSVILTEDGELESIMGGSG